MCFGARILPMGRLDELDLSLKLSRAEEDDRLSAAQERRSVGDGPDS